MTRPLLLVGLLVSVTACHDRPGPNDLLVSPLSGVTVGTPVYNGRAVVGRVVRTRTIDNEVWATLRFDADSLAPSSLGQVRVRYTGLGAPARLYVEPGSRIPVFGRGGYIKGAAPPR
jgi:hypothetical protein